MREEEDNEQSRGITREQGDDMTEPGDYDRAGE